MSEGGFPPLQEQIANLNAAQRVGIVAAVALSSFAVYATTKHRDICGGPLDSPRHRTNCPLNFLTCAPSNDINASIANIHDTIANASDALTDSLNTAMADFDWDPANWDIPTVGMPRMPQLPGFPRQLEPLLGCPHDEALSHHPHAQTCLQCKELRRCSNVLERAYMDWTTANSPPEDEAAQLLRCPHNQRISPHATACVNCAERSYTNELERGRMSNWTADHPTGDVGSPGMSSGSSVSSFKSMLGSDVSQGAQDLVADAQHALGAGGAAGAGDAAVAAAARRAGDEGVVARRGGGGGVGKTAMYLFFWYLCTVCNDKFRIKNKSNILSRFPAPHLLQAFGFVFQFFFVYEVHKHKFQFFTTPSKHLTWTSNMNIVIPIAVATSFDIVLDLNQGGIDDQFNKLCKSGSPLFILIIAYIFGFENPTFKLTTSISSITIGSLLTIAKALDYNYELPDVLALTTGASLSALRWAGAQYLLQKQDKGSPIVTMGRLAPWMSICTFIFSIAFEKSWQMITHIDYFFDSPIDMLEGFGQLLIFYVLWTMEILADFLLITNTSAVTFIVVKTLKTIGDLGSKILMKGLYHEERQWIEREKTMNEETIGLYYFRFGLVIFLWQRYQEWSQTKSSSTSEGGGRRNNYSNYTLGGDGKSERGRRNNNSRNSLGGGDDRGEGGRRNNNKNTTGHDKGGGGGRSNSNKAFGSIGDGGGEARCGRRRSRGGEVCGRTGCDGGEACGRTRGGGSEVYVPRGGGEVHQCTANTSSDLLLDRQCFHDIF